MTPFLFRYAVYIVRRVLTYLFAIAAMAVAVLVRALLDPFLGDAFPLVTLFGAVAVTVVMWGIGPAVLAAVTGYFACSYLFVEPRGTLRLLTSADIVGFVAYLFTCALIIALGRGRASCACARQRPA